MFIEICILVGVFMVVVLFIIVLIEKFRCLLMDGLRDGYDIDSC